MTSAELEQQVRARHAAGASPKEIARALSVRPAVVIPIVRRVAGESHGRRDAAVRGCWVNPGWSEGLTIDDDRDWPRGEAATVGGLVTVVVAREHRYDKVSVCVYLVDVYCLGVKNVLGPRVMSEHELSEFVPAFFASYGATPIPAPIELAQHLVLGAIDYARSLGFDRHPDFDLTRSHIGELTGPGAIRFGRDGKPFFVQGPDDDPERIIRKLEESVGRENFHFMVGGHAFSDST
jgi:hypothetical protein